MTRSLRPRKQRPNFASLLDTQNEDSPPEDAESSDEFQPPNEEEEAKDDLEILTSDKESSEDRSNSPEQHLPPSDSILVERISIVKEGKKKDALPRTSVKTSKSTNTYVFDHRSRGDPLYLRRALVERLAQPPKPFAPPITVPTPPWNVNKSSAERYSKACAYDVGRGPVWELLEDRSWWKESLNIEEGKIETEAMRRPRVHKSVKVDVGLQLIDRRDAEGYLPTVGGTSNSYEEPTIKCHFGPPNANVLKELKMFDSIDMSGATDKTHVFFAGGPVWGLDWCPVYAEDRPYRSYLQYVAVAPLPSKTYSPQIGQKCPTPCRACIQIWRHSLHHDHQSSLTKGKEKATESDANFGKLTCDLVLCVECGPAHELKWCPLPSHDPWVERLPDSPRKLGLIAGAFEDGSLSIFTVPDPDDLRDMAGAGTMFVKLQPAVRIELEETCIMTLDWANSEKIAVGCTNGSIAVYDIKYSLSRESTQELLPTHYFSAHQSAVRSIRWIPIPPTSAYGQFNFDSSPTMIASGGYDGCETVTDIRDGYDYVINRTRDVHLSVTYSHYSGGVVCADNDNTVKMHSMSPGIFGRGNFVMESGGPIWNLHASDYHPMLASASADGSVVVTNLLRPIRRNVTTPFLFHKIFQMDYSRKRGGYRMLDHFLPQEFPERSSVSLAKKGKNKRREEEKLSTGAQGTGVWPAEVSVTRVCWNDGAGLSRAPLLAAATASGLCRIDWLLEHFQDGRIPYGGVENIRVAEDSEDVMTEDEGE